MNTSRVDSEQGILFCVYREKYLFFSLNKHWIDLSIKFFSLFGMIRKLISSTLVNFRFMKYLPNLMHDLINLSKHKNIFFKLSER